MRLATLPLRTAALPMRTAPRVPVRALSVSARRFASEDSRSPLEQTLPSGLEKIKDSPSALAAIQRLSDVLQKNGLDMSNGQKPSMAQMAKLATNAEVRECTAKGTYRPLTISR